MHDAHCISHTQHGSNDHISHGISTTSNNHIDLGSPHASVGTSHQFTLNVVKYSSASNTQHKTMYLLLAILSLKRYHSIWFISHTTSSPVIPTDKVILLGDSTSRACATRRPSLLRSTLASTPQLITTQLLLSSILTDGTSK